MRTVSVVADVLMSSTPTWLFPESVIVFGPVMVTGSPISAGY